MDKNLTNKDNFNFVFFLSIVLFALLTLPLIPVWAACFRIVAITLCASCMAEKGKQFFSRKGILLLVTVAFFLTVFISDVYSAINATSPFSHIVKSVKSVFGHPFGIEAAFSVYLIDLLIISMATRLLWPQSNKQGRNLIASLLLFYFFSQGRLFLDFFSVFIPWKEGDFSLNNLTAQLNGLSTWTIWIIGFLVTVHVAKTANAVKVILYTCLGAGVLQALIIDLQWLLSDFSYVLESVNFSQYFYRVRGTYYYHGSSCQALMLLFFVSLSLYAFGESRRLVLLHLLMASALYINTTRAISLTMIVGCLSFLFFMFLMRQKNRAVPVLLVLIILPFASEVLVLKPLDSQTEASFTAKETNRIKDEEFGFAIPNSKSNELDSVIINPLRNQTEKQQGITPAPSMDMVSANSFRSTLFKSGLGLFTETILIGQGVGTAKVPLPRTSSFAGIENTYSTHAFLPDIFIMGGGLAAFLLVIFVCLSLKLAAQKILKEPATPTAWILSSLFSGIITYILSSFFFSQERSFVILLAFIVLGLIVSLVEITSLSTKDSGIKPPLFHKVSIAGLSAGAFLWAIAVSPSFGFPAIEFCLKHHQGEPVFTNSPRLKFLVEHGCRFKNEKNTVVVLKDNVHSLPDINEGWVLWSSHFDQNYPELRRVLGHNQHRGWERMPSINLLNNWAVVKNYQSTIFFVKVGTQKKTFNSEDAGQFKWHQVPNDDWDSLQFVTSIEKNSLKKDNDYILSFVPHLEAGIPLSGFFLEFAGSSVEELPIEYELKLATGKTVRGKVGAKMNENETMKASLDFEMDTVTALRLKLPGIASTNVSLQLSSNFYPQHRTSSDFRSMYKLFDHNHGTYYRVAGHSDSGEIQVDLGPDEIRPIKLYRFSGVKSMKNGTSPRQWKVFGSKDLKSWDLVDFREGVNLTSGLRNFDSFYIKNTKKNRFYKFKFYTLDENSDKWLSEIELFLQ